ncbi:MAG: YihY family inner membrane protein [Candidatus Hydrogenedentes bacterium]|nr:YihY family inner membrane protein [Candidatus Hydrogenedentota bacterium]
MASYVQRAWEAFERGRRFVTHDVWHIGRPGEPLPHGFIIKQVRVTILLVRNFVQDALLLRASALTFATMLAIVPFLALMFFLVQTLNLETEIYQLAASRLGISPAETTAGEEGPSVAASAGANGQIKTLLLDWIFSTTSSPTISAPTQGAPSEGTSVSPTEPHPAPSENPVVPGSPMIRAVPRDSAMKSSLESLLNYAEGKSNLHTVGLAGLIFIVTTVFGLLMNIESSFNSIWGVKRTRSWYHMFSNYVMVILLLPFLVVGVLSVTAVLASSRVVAELGSFASLLRSVQYVVIWLVFAALYCLLPNTRVQFRYALLGGVVAGTLWSLVSWSYVKFQFGFANYSLLYSAFAQIPLLLMWVYVSWVVLLFGAELTFAYQNEKTFAMEQWAAGASHAYREALGLRVMLEMARRFDAGEPGISVTECAEQWNVPVRLLNETLDQLQQTGMVVQCATKPVTHQPARSIEKITLGDVVRALRESGREPSPLRADEVLQPLLAKLGQAENGVLASTLAQAVRTKSP